MSRALNLDATEAHVIRRCAEHNAPISAIESLVSGGTRVVLKTADDAAVIARSYGASVLAGPVRRTPIRMAGQQQPASQPAPSHRRTDFR